MVGCDCCISIHDKCSKEQSKFSDEDIGAFQDMADDFYKKWIDLHGKKDVTKYFHMIAPDTFHTTYRFIKIYIATCSRGGRCSTKRSNLSFSTTCSGVGKLMVGQGEINMNTCIQLVTFYIINLDGKHDLGRITLLKRRHTAQFHPVQGSQTCFIIKIKYKVTQKNQDSKIHVS